MKIPDLRNPVQAVPRLSDKWEGQRIERRVGEIRMGEEINVLALVKDDQRYVFLYDEASFDELLRTLGRYASDPELNFSWYDAAMLSQRVRKLRKQVEQDRDDDQFYRKSA